MEQTVKAVKALNYAGVGTLEFLLDETGRFFILWR